MLQKKIQNLELNNKCLGVLVNKKMEVLLKRIETPKRNNKENLTKNSFHLHPTKCGQIK